MRSAAGPVRAGGAAAFSDSDGDGTVMGQGRDLRAWSTRAAWALVAAVVAVQTVAVGTFALRGYFWADDLLTLVVASEPLSLEHVLHAVYQHFIPGYRVVFWGLRQGFPGSFPVAVALMLGFHALSSVALVHLLRRFCGLELAAVLTLLWGISPVVLRSALWISAGLQYFPCTCFSLFALERVLCYWREGRPSTLVVAGASLLLALSFFIKGIFVVGYLGLLWLLVPALRPRERLWPRTLASLGLFALITTAYLVYYVVNYYIARGYDSAPTPTLAQLVAFYVSGTVQVLLPSFVGLMPARTAGSWVLGLGLAALLAAGCIRCRGGWRAVLFLLIALAPNLLLVARARIGVGSFEGVLLDLRYYTEASYLLALSLGLLAGALGPALVHGLRRVRSATPGGARPALAGALLVVLVGGWGTLFVRAGEQSVQIWDMPTVRAYVTRLGAGLAAVRERHGNDPTRFAFFNLAVPGHILPRWLDDGLGRYRYREFFRLFMPDIQFDVPAEATYAVDLFGNVLPATLQPVASSVQGAAEHCLRAGQSAEIALAEHGSLPEGVFELELSGTGSVSGLLQPVGEGSASAARALVWVRRPDASVALVSFDEPWSVRRVRIQLAENSAPACLLRMRMASYRTSAP